MLRLSHNRSIDRRRRWTLAIAYLTLLASCDSPFAPDVEEVTRLDVTPAVLTLAVGGNATLIARVYGAGGVLLPTARVFWSSQDLTVVTIDQNGGVSAVGAGTAQIAASSGGQSRTIAVTVAPRPIALVRINPPAASVVAGQTLALQGEALDGTGAILPNRLLEWTTSAPEIATVNGTGLVTGVSIGQATISATGEGKTGTSIVTVLRTPVANITVTPDGGSLQAGATLALTATARDAGGQPLTGRPLLWTSSNDAVATVSSSGLLTAISPGTVTITVSAPGEGPNGTTPSTSVLVNVLIEQVANAMIVPSTLSLQVGQDFGLTINLFNTSGDPLSPQGRTIDWNSSNPAVATVNSSGMVTGVTVGNATITSTITTPGQAGSIQATAQIIVSNQPVVAVEVVPNPAVVHVGYSRQFAAITRNSAGQPLPGRPVVWTSSNQSVATVDQGSGVVSGVSQGQAQIRATSEGIVGVANVSIDLVAVSTVGVLPGSATLTPGQQAQLSATPRDSAGNTIAGPALGARQTTWTSLNTATATVNATGLVTAVAQGAATITASIGGANGQAGITVNPLPSASQLALTTHPSSSSQNDIAFPVQPVVQLKDASGSNVLTPGVVVQVAITPPGTGTLGGTLTATTDVAGAATFSGLKITGTIGARTLRFTSGSLTAATSGSIDVTPGAPTQLALTTPPPATANSGQVFSSSAVVRLRDVSGNNVLQSGVSVSAAVSPSAGVTLAGGSSSTDGTGAATFSALTLSGPAGNYTLTFSSGALTPASSGAIALSAGSGSKLALTQQPSATVQSGVVFPAQPIVQLRDGADNPVAQAGVVVSVAILTGGGTLGGSTTATTNASGVATFTGLSISGTIGVRTLLFGASGYTTVTSNNVNVTPGPAASLAVSVQPPSPTPSGSAFSPQPAVQLRDASGNAVSQGGVAVSVSLNGAGASLTGTTTASTNASGVATFSGLGLSGTVGTYSLTFSSGSLTSATSNSISLVAGAATQLTMATQPAGASSGAAFTTQPRAQLRDAAGNAVGQSGITVTASIQSGPVGGSLVGSATASTNSSGLAVFTGLGLSGTVGTYTLRFDAPSLTGATSGNIALAAGAAAQLVIITQPAGAASGAAFTTQPAVQIRDAQSNPVLQAGTTITAAVTGGGATLVGSATAATAGTGTATYAGLGLSGTVGNYTLTFSSAGLPNVVSATIALGPGAPGSLTMSTQPPASVTSGTAFSTAPAVQLRDGAGNLLTTNGVSVSVAISAGGATLTGTTTRTTTSGIATFTGLGASGTVGSYTLIFTSSGLTGVTSSSFTVVAGAAAQLTITTQPAGASSGTAFTTQPRIQVRDAQGNPVSQSGISVTASIAGGPPGAALVGSTSATTGATGLATFVGLGLSGTVGNYTLAFAASGLSGVTSGSFALGPGAPAQLTIQTQPAGAASGSPLTTQPVLQVRDAQSNLVSQVVTVTAAVNGAGASLIGSATAQTVGGIASYSGLGLSGLAGTYSLTFSASGVPNATSSTFALAAGAATQLTMATQPSASVASGSALAQAPAVQLRDGAGNVVSQAGVNVSVGIAPSGAALTGSTVAATNASGIATFTGLGITGLVGNYTLAFSGSGLSGATSSSISVTPGAASALTITTQPPSTAASGNAFAPSPTVQLRDVSGNAVSQSGVSITASLNGPAGNALIGTPNATTNGSGLATFTGLGISGSTAGSYTITFSSGSLTSVTSSSITVSVPPTKLGMFTQPSSTASSGVAFAQQPAVRLLDASDNPVSQAGVQVSVTLVGGGGSLFGAATATTNASGVATFTGLGISGFVGSYSLSFTSSGLTGVSSSSITLGPGAATQVVLTTQPSANAASGAPFPQQPVARLRDAAGNNVQTAGVSVTASIQTGAVGSTLQNPGATTNGSGVATFSGLGITGLAGSYTLLFSAPGVSGTATASVTLGAGAATQLTITTQPGNATVNVPFGTQPVIQIRDSAGNPVDQALVFITASVATGTGSLGGFTTVTTNGSGVASFSGLSLNASGNHSLQFSGGGLVPVVSIVFVVNP